MCGKAEEVATWYFRLNGFLTTTNFILHPEMGTVQLTDVDVVAVRFPWRHESAGDELIDDTWVRELGEVTSVVIAEVKRGGNCKLNGPTRDPDRHNLQRVIRALGTFTPCTVDEVATGLYSDGSWASPNHRALLCCLGAKRSPKLSARFPKCQQVTWEDVARFIHHRFTAHVDQKKQHQQWDDLGQRLWKWSKTLNAQNFERELVKVL